MFIGYKNFSLRLVDYLEDDVKASNWFLVLVERTSWPKERGERKAFYCMSFKKQTQNPSLILE
jgi:hypothetical protein